MRRVFFSFHYQNDIWRVSQIRNIGQLNNEAKPFADTVEWESIKRAGDKEIKRWIDNQMEDVSTVVVLIGSETAHRKYVLYEIEQGYYKSKAMIGIYIHNLLDQNGKTSKKGENPFSKIYFNGFPQRPFDYYYKVYEPNPLDPYNDIRDNIESWIDNATGMARL